MYGYEIRPGQQFVERHSSHITRGELLVPHMRVEGDDLQSEGMGLRRNEAWNIAKSNQSQNAPFQTVKGTNRRQMPASGLDMTV